MSESITITNSPQSGGFRGAPFDTDKINAIPIRQVAEALGIGMKERNAVVWAQCVFHADSNPSMEVGSKSGRYNTVHCFSCGKTTNVIGLVMHCLGVGFLDACKWIEDAFPAENVRTADAPRRERKKGYDVHAMERIVNRGRMGERNGNGMNVRLTTFEAELKRACTQQPNPPLTGELEGSLSVQQPNPPLTGELEGSMSDATQSSFARCLTEVFGEAVMERVVEDYQLGAWKANGRYDDVMFPSIDSQGRIRDVKIQAYDCDVRSDRFFHSLRNVMYWLGPRLFPDAEFDRNCLFGEHLLTEHPDMTVALVESPKNACVGAAHFPQYLWLATGNKNMLRRDTLRVLQGRKVLVFPDEDAFAEWHAKLQTMTDIATFLCIHTPGEDAKRDIADYVLTTKRQQNEI